MPAGHPRPPREPIDIGILTVIPPELDAARNALALSEYDKAGLNDTIYLRGIVRSVRRGCDYTVVLAGIGTAGNLSAAALAAQMIERYHPRVVLLMGIAAGMRGKVRIGEVVLSERVVAYEQAALVAGEGGTRQVQPRPDITRASHGLLQDALHYQPDPRRLVKIFECIRGTFPPAAAGKEDVWRQHVASSIECRKQVTIASGEKLLRDPSKLLEVRGLHGKVEVGEMEAAGVVEACLQTNTPWFVIRGISDFGDELKNDAFHGFASRSAAAVLADFIAHGLDLGEEHAESARRNGSGERKSPFIVGMPITREQDLFGRQHERAEILDAVDKKEPVQLLGGAKVGKSSLLNWAARHVAGGRPVAWIGPGGTLSPVKLVSEIAREVGRPEVVERLAQKAGDAHAAAAQLQALGSLVLIMDDADNLAKVGRDFEEGFFEVVRECVERGALTWVSASRQDLFDLFGQKGLSSRFLNSSRKIWVGPLAEEAARDLVAQGERLHVERVLREAGGFAYGLQWLGDRLLRDSENMDDACEEFRIEMEAYVFASWWKGLQPDERAALKQCADAEVSGRGEADLRRCLRRLRDRGLLMENAGCYRLAPGDAWQEFVRDAR
jgi:nucleoside phosphorylase